MESSHYYFHLEMMTCISVILASVPSVLNGAVDYHGFVAAPHQFQMLTIAVVQVSIIAMLIVHKGCVQDNILKSCGGAPKLRRTPLKLTQLIHDLLCSRT